MSEMNAERVLALVNRGVMEITPQVAFRHELKLKQELYGQGNVTLAEKQVGPGVGAIETLDVDSEWNRLANIYGMHPTVNMPMVEYVYGPADKNKLADESVKKPKPKKKTTMLSVKEIKAYLDDNGVDYKKNARRGELLAILDKDLKTRLSVLDAEWDDDAATEILFQRLRDLQNAETNKEE